jgi:hypothetical protein
MNFLLRINDIFVELQQKKLKKLYLCGFAELLSSEKEIETIDVLKRSGPLKVCLSKSFVSTQIGGI